MITLNSFVASLAISQSIFLAAFITLHYRKSTTGKLLILFSICLSAYLLTSIPQLITNPYLSFILFRLATFAPAALWLIATRLFDDKRHVSPIALTLIAAYILAYSTGAILFYQDYEFTRVSFFFTFVIAQAIMLGFAVHVVYLGIKGKKADLIGARRKVRTPLVIAMGLLNTVVIGAGFVNYLINNYLQVNDPSAFTYYNNTLLLALALMVSLTLNIKIFSLHADAAVLLESPRRAPVNHSVQSSAPDQKDSELVQRIKKAMVEEKLYQEMGLTLGRLAEHLSVQDYRLREAINKKMAFRNFNQFLNHFRVIEASNLLLETRIPIATIALDVGYASLSSFNKAFKEQHGIPPRDFRVQEKKDSASS